MTEVSTRRRGGAGESAGLTPLDPWQVEQAQNEVRQQFLDQLGVFNQQYDVTINRPPIMGGHKLDLHALFNIVLEHQVCLRAFARAHCPRVAARDQRGAHAACACCRGLP